AERGKNFLYHRLALLRNRGEKINFARYVYILSRLEPQKDASPEQKDAYKEFSTKMYQWYRGETEEADCRHLKTAINLYAYLTRDKEEMTDEDR
ncbi:MAG: type III-A CRISPR-associated protein Cas10/Csm1, partial [Lachnospiraceae bacterium]|nr:type III-A CRISPR-associated protein Cas10/Csm1 [Lachnospiraceae bacterium]